MTEEECEKALEEGTWLVRGASLVKISKRWPTDYGGYAGLHWQVHEEDGQHYTIRAHQLRPAKALDFLKE